MFVNLRNRNVGSVILPILLLLLMSVMGLADEKALTGTGEDENGSSDFLQQGSRQSGLVFIPGDAVSISTLPDSSSFLNNVFPIDDRGFVELPIYGKIKISHMTADQLVTYLRDQFEEQLIYNDIQVKPMIRISVLGGIPLPGFYYVDPDHSLWEVMRLVGGTQDEDGLRDMRWKRSGENIEDDLIPSLQSGISLKRMGFRSGDQIWVRTPNKPGTLEKVRGYLNLITATASAATLIITYQIALKDR